MVYEVANGVLIYYLPEELDHYAADMLKRKTAHVFDEEEIRYLIFDFSKTQFMDSSGIGLITGRFRMVHDKGGCVYAVHGDCNTAGQLSQSLLQLLSVEIRSGLFDLLLDLCDSGL